jgi:predicted nucleotidyltransferase
LIDKGKIQGLDFYAFIHNLEDVFGLSVDVVTYDSLKDSLIYDAADNEVVLYEQ